MDIRTGPEWQLERTIGMLLDGARFDPDATAALGLTSDVRGAAFRTASGEPAYVLWARVTTMDEQGSAPFDLAAVGPHRLYAWDHSETGDVQQLSRVGAYRFR